MRTVHRIRPRRMPSRRRLVNTIGGDANGGILDSHLFFYDRYSDLAEYHRLKGRTAKANRLAASAEAYYQAAPDDDEPEAAAMAMPVPRPRINTNAVSSTRVPRPPADESSGVAPSPAH